MNTNEINRLFKEVNDLYEHRLTGGDWRDGDIDMLAANAKAVSRGISEVIAEHPRSRWLPIYRDYANATLLQLSDAIGARDAGKCLELARIMHDNLGNANQTSEGYKRAKRDREARRAR